MRIRPHLCFLGLCLVLALLAGCATDPLDNVTSKRTVAQVQTKIHKDMPLEELLDYVKCTPIMTGGYDRCMLADGDLWITEGRNEKGWVIVEDYRFEKR